MSTTSGSRPRFRGPMRASNSPSRCSTPSSRQRVTCSEVRRAFSRPADADGGTPLYTTPPTAYMYYLSSIAQGFIASQYPNLSAVTTTTSSHSRRSTRSTAGRITVGADVVVMVQGYACCAVVYDLPRGRPGQEAWIKLGGFTSVNRSVPSDTYSGSGWAKRWRRRCHGCQDRSLRRRGHDARVIAAGLVGSNAAARQGSEPARRDSEFTDQRGQDRYISGSAGNEGLLALLLQSHRRTWFVACLPQVGHQDEQVARVLVVDAAEMLPHQVLQELASNRVAAAEGHRFGMPAVAVSLERQDVGGVARESESHVQVPVLERGQARRRSRPSTPTPRA